MKIGDQEHGIVFFGWLALQVTLQLNMVHGNGKTIMLFDTGSLGWESNLTTSVGTKSCFLFGRQISKNKHIADIWHDIYQLPGGTAKQPEKLPFSTNSAFLVLGGKFLVWNEILRLQFGTWSCSVFVLSILSSGVKHGMFCGCCSHLPLLLRRLGHDFLSGEASTQKSVERVFGFNSVETQTY